MLLAIPALSFFGAKEGWTKLYGWEKSTKVVPITSAIVLGDCYRDQIVKIFRDAKLFEPKKIVRAKRHGAQKAQDFRNIIADLRLVVMTYQSFNTDRLDERETEIANVFAAMREARKIGNNKNNR